MKRVVIFAAKKGGAGKSYASRAFIDCARAVGRTVSAWDLDGQTGTLGLVYGIGDPTIAVGVEDVRDPRASGRWLDAMFGTADDVVLDVPGGALADLLRTFSAGPAALIAEIKSSGRELVIASVLTHKKDGTATAFESVQVFGSDVRHVVVKNTFYAPAEAFIMFDGLLLESGERKFGKAAAAVASVRGEVVVLPKLEAEADAMCDAEGLTFSIAAGAHATIGRRAAGNVRYWLQSVATAFAGSWLDVHGNVPKAKAQARGSAA